MYLEEAVGMYMRGDLLKKVVDSYPSMPRRDILDRSTCTSENKKMK